MKRNVCSLMMALALIGKVVAQTPAAGSAQAGSAHGGSAPAGTLPALINKDGHHALLVDGKPFFILGGQAHNSSAWPSTMPSVWQSIERMHANTLEVPLYWEQVEPLQGKFDFTLVDLLLAQARAHQVRLVLLWFGTWKNGSNHYMPPWMKRDSQKYPNISGEGGKLNDSPSPFAIASLEADKNTFSHIMRHLREVDARHTVIMMQVENEPGTWGSVRDFGAQAQRLFDGPVPSALLDKSVLEALHAAPSSGDGAASATTSTRSANASSATTWKEVFGDRADEYFHAWYIARYIDQVAAAGKAAYPLPMYVNVALRDPFGNPPATNYESGGATDNVIPIWKAAAKSIDLLAPDIYLDGHATINKVMDLYTRPDNALFVPEGQVSTDKAKFLFGVAARGGIGFAPFGIDNNGGRVPDSSVSKSLTAFADEYAVLEPMDRQLAQWSFEGRIQSVVESEDQTTQYIDMGNWQAKVSFGTGERDVLKPNNPPTGKMMIIPLTENKFVLIGSGCHIGFKPTGPYAGKAWQYLKVEEGYFKDGSFHFLRILNGDETDWGGPAFWDKTTVLQVELVAR